MRFWWTGWEPRERSLSSDSECSTGSHSSLASDASFYDASSVAETGLGGELTPLPSDTQLLTGKEAGQSDLRMFPDGSSTAYPQAVGRNCLGTVAVGLGLGVPNFTLDVTTAPPGNGPCAGVRATPPRGGDAKLGTETSGTCCEHASPSARDFPRAQMSLSHARPPGLRPRFWVPS
uniref:Uncharacterized protein n=1 Tax=Peronospora matthiolae TaxID=2874970 RepID=A0AAV1T4D0_9STRA